MESFAGVMLSISVLTALAAMVAQTKWWPRVCALNSFPFSNREFFFSAAERSCYEILRRITPDHTVFAKVRLSDVIFVARGSRAGRCGSRSKCVDFLICDAALKPVVAIELETCSQSVADRKAGDQFIDAALAAVAIPIVRMPAKRSYGLDEIRPLIFPHLHGLGPAC
jgi:Protein of unknown function (DUF2726)